MEQHRHFVVSINVANPIGFAAEIDKNVMLSVQDSYEKRNYCGSFIKNIDKIVKTSVCTILSSNNSGAGTINVAFDATVIVAAKDDIICGVKLMKNTDVLVGLTSLSNPELDMFTMSFQPS